MTTLQEMIVPEASELGNGEITEVSEESGGADTATPECGRQDKCAAPGSKPPGRSFADIPTEDPRDKKCRVAMLKSRIAVFR